MLTKNTALRTLDDKGSFFLTSRSCKCKTNNKSKTVSNGTDFFDIIQRVGKTRGKSQSRVYTTAEVELN